MIAPRVLSKQAIADRNAALSRHILAGGMPKEFAADHGVTKQLVGRLLAPLGIRRKWVTKDESDRIDRERRHKPGLDGQAGQTGE